MFRRLTLAALLLALWAPVSPARAVTCALDDLPAATLLLPYFEVDLDRPLGRTTLFSINNASATSILTNVTLWTDLGVPALYFQVYLTGYDVQTINLRDLFNGVLPRTASHGQDPQDSVSPQGEFSQDLNFASCTGILPLPPLPPSYVEHLRAAFTGRHSNVLNGCAAQFLGDNVARGYVTVDTVNQCAIKSPADPGYFGPEGMATNQNVLWGDFFLIDQADGDAQGDNLVRIEADPDRFHPGDATFYGRYTGGTAADAREPLPSLWATRYLSGGAFSGGTDLLVWRDSGEVNHPFDCTARPSWYPLVANRYIAFDEEETPFTGGIECPFTCPPPPLFDFLPAETNRFRVGQERESVPFPFGWLLLDLDRLGSRGEYLGPRQAWVGAVMSAGRYSLGGGATPLLSGCAPHPGPAVTPLP